MSIYAKTADGWLPIVGGGSEPGAAEITAITGSGITHTYDDFVAFEFLTSGSLTCTEGIVPEALIVGGGGSGGKSIGGGGGSGGYISATSVYLSAATHTVMVGAGGPTNTFTPILNGKPSAVGLIIALGGGGGGNSNGAGGDGGSGGGGAGSAYAPQGNDAGVTRVGASGVARNGGGGSPTEVGYSGTVSGNGASGISSSITGSAVILAAGGGAGGYNVTAGVGGSSIGGSGTTNNNAASAGQVNTGSGGGGGGYPGSGAGGNGGAGGSGVVIVKVLAVNAASVDKSGWTEVTALMLAEAKKKRELERKAEQLTRVLEEKNEELSGATQMDIEGDLI